MKFFLLLCGAALTADPPAKDAEPTTLAATVTLRDVDVGELLDKLKNSENIKLDLGYAIGGKVTVTADIAVPLGDATTSKSYTVRGKVTSAELRLEGLRLQDLAANVDFVDGKLTLTGLTAKLPAPDPSGTPGTLSGSATAAFSPRGDLTASLKLTRVPLAEALKAVPGGVDVSGVASGTAEFRAPVNDLYDPASWVASADLTAPAVTAFGRAVTNAAAKVAVKGGKATLTELSAEVEGIPTTADATVTLSGKYPFTAAARTKPRDVSELQKLVPELELPVAIRGKLSADATAEGTLNPSSVSASGSVTVDDFAIGDSPADKLSAKWKLTPERVTLTDLKAGVFKGTLGGSADVPLVPDKAGEFKLTFAEVDAAAVAGAFPKVPVKVTGRVSGGVTGTLPAAKPDQPRAATADVNLTAPKLTVQGIPAEKLTGKLSLDGTAVRYELEGKTLGGSFEVRGRYPTAEKPPLKPEGDDSDGRVVLRGLDLSRLAEALKLSNVALRGVVDFTFDYTSDLTGGNGRYSVRGFGLGKDVLVPEIGGRVRLRNGTLELADAVGPLSGGTVRARVRASLTEPTRNFYRLDVDRLDIGRLLGGFTARPGWLDGAVSLTARGRLWPEFTAAGAVVLSRGRLGGVGVSDLRLPYSVSVRAGGGRVHVREVSGFVGDGRVSGQFEYGWGASGRTTGQVKFVNVRLGRVLADLRQTNYFGQARVTGRIDVSGDNVRSLDDMSATVSAAIAEAGVRDLPVIDTVTPFVPPTALLQPFDAGELRGRLSRGVFRVERLTLASPQSDLYADGTITTAGRLYLGVIIRTGTVGLNDSLLRELGLTLPLPVGPLPAQLIRDVSVFLSNRTVRLTVTGTVAQPHPEVNTAALLADEAVRFFLRRYLPTAAAVLPEITPRSNR